MKEFFKEKNEAADRVADTEKVFVQLFIPKIFFSVTGKYNYTSKYRQFSDRINTYFRVCFQQFLLFK